MSPVYSHFTLFLLHNLLLQDSFWRDLYVRKAPAYSKVPLSELCFIYKFCHISCSFVMQQPNSRQDDLIVEISRSHIYNTHTLAHENPVGFLWKSDQLFAEAATSTTNTRDENPCPQRVSNSLYHQRAATDLRLRPRVHWDRPRSFCVLWFSGRIWHYLASGDRHDEMHFHSLCVCFINVYELTEWGRALLEKLLGRLSRYLRSYLNFMEPNVTVKVCSQEAVSLTNQVSPSQLCLCTIVNVKSKNIAVMFSVIYGIRWMGEKSGDTPCFLTCCL